jgi:hypothetical protein
MSTTNCCLCGGRGICCHQGPCIYCSEHDPSRNTRRVSVELEIRYRGMPDAAWFRAAHEGRPLGEGMKVE